VGSVNEPRYLRKFVLDPDQVRMLDHHLGLCDDLAAEIEQDFSAGRERSLALTKLDEMVYWLTKSAVA